MRLLKILWADIKCSCYCMWHLLRYYDCFCEFKAYDKDNRLIFIAATKGKMLNKELTDFDGNFQLIKIFYNEKGIKI